MATQNVADVRPILIVPYMWIGDFVRGHTVVRVLRQRWPNRPIDMLVTPLCAPLVDYMPGVRSGVVWDLPRSRLAVTKQWGLAKVRPALALPDREPLPAEWPTPQLRVSAAEVNRWRQANRLGTGTTVALAPGSVGASKRWSYYPQAARLLVDHGFAVWVVGGPAEKALADEIAAVGGPGVRDLTGTDLRNGILAMAAANLAISNDSGLMHIAAALGTPTMGIFGPTSPYHWAPLNGLAATVQTKTMPPCQPCHRPVCSMNEHRCMRHIAASDVAGIAERVLAAAGAGLAR